MTLAERITADGKGLFLDTDDFAESVTYVPHNYAGETVRVNRTINAVVIRHSVHLFEVHVANDVLLGITSTEIDVGRDQLSFAKRTGGTAAERTIQRMPTHDEGMLVLECR